ncbi:MAG: hypothetical protein EBX60_10890, partial [Betaproteobacteria bacterium]|nr:hypothetical protein [Betaproteobacteria bacterium]
VGDVQHQTPPVIGKTGSLKSIPSEKHQQQASRQRAINLMPCSVMPDPVARAVTTTSAKGADAHG